MRALESINDRRIGAIWIHTIGDFGGFVEIWIFGLVNEVHHHLDIIVEMEKIEFILVGELYGRDIKCGHYKRGFISVLIWCEKDLDVFWIFNEKSSVAHERSPYGKMQKSLV
jgi:hypothetical protein